MGLCETGTDDPQIHCFCLSACMLGDGVEPLLPTMTLGLQADPWSFASLTPLKARLCLKLMGVDGGLKGQTQEFGFQDSKRGEQARMEGMRRSLTRQRVMRPECQLPKGKDKASCGSMRTTHGLFLKDTSLFGWAGPQLAAGRTLDLHCGV